MNYSIMVVACVLAVATGALSVYCFMTHPKDNKCDTWEGLMIERIRCEARGGSWEKMQCQEEH